MRYLSIIFALLTSLIFASCDDSDDITAPRGSAPRTVLVYMVASNDLGSGGYDSRDLAEMQQAIANGDLGGSRWLIYRHPDGATPYLAEMTPTGIDTLVVYPASLLSVDPRRISAVCTDVRRLAPADDYGLIMWSHSTGWPGPASTSASASRDLRRSPRSWGADRGYQVDIPALATAIAPLRPSFIYFDCCYMASVEVAYELRDITDFIVASPTEIPSDGMPYDLNVAPLASPQADLLQAARNTFGYYSSLASVVQRSCTVTVIDTRALSRLATISRAIYARYGTEAPGYTPQRLHRDKPQLFWDFADHVRALTASDTELSSEFESAFADAVPLHLHTARMWNLWSLDRSTGLSAYIYPAEGGDPDYYSYSSLQWWRDVVSPAIPQ
ncbi:MAG: clostripain-related cysteine peptidase [Pseudoflavonifractor sp.]|nr:clostripain-related cysteine peptidase [Pseudoflavonifractor sp.]